MTSVGDRHGAGGDAVVVLSFYGREDTERCVESLVRGSPEAQILVIDNGSFDGVLESVQQRWPSVTTLQTGTNLGFSGGMNRGIEWALAAGFETITVLNNDTVVPPGAIAALGKVARTGVAASPEVRYADGTERVWFGGGVIDEDTSLARHLSEAEIRETNEGTRASTRPSEVLAGCCVTASAETWRSVGLFDERYFLNFEDSDWSIRATHLGVPLVVVTDVIIYHRVSASFTGAHAHLGLFYYTRNGLLFGSMRHRWDVATRLRFLRRHVVPVLGRDVRRHEWVQASRHSLVILSAISAHAARHYGRAPGWLEKRASVWARS